MARAQHHPTPPRCDIRCVQLNLGGKNIGDAGATRLARSMRPTHAESGLLQGALMQSWGIACRGACRGPRAVC